MAMAISFPARPISPGTWRAQFWNGNSPLWKPNSFSSNTSDCPEIAPGFVLGRICCRTQSFVWRAAGWGPPPWAVAAKPGICTVFTESIRNKLKKCLRTLLPRPCCRNHPLAHRFLSPDPTSEIHLIFTTRPRSINSNSLGFVSTKSVEGLAMQLSVEVKNLNDAAVLVCRGQIVQGAESEYLFALATRSDRRDVILDVEAVSGIDEGGLFVIALCYQILSAARRRLFLRNPSPEILDGLRRQQVDLFLEKLQEAGTSESEPLIH